MEVGKRTKGLPFAAENVPLSEIGRQGWNLLAENLPLPVAVLREAALANNSRWMREFLALTGAKLAAPRQDDVLLRVSSQQVPMVQRSEARAACAGIEMVKHGELGGLRRGIGDSTGIRRNRYQGPGLS